jgi:hypothetical protein
MYRPPALTIAGAPPARVSLLLPSLLLALAACNPFVRPYRGDPAVQMRRDGDTMASQWNGTLAAPTGTGAAALTGMVTATPGLEGTSTYVSVTLASAPPGASYAWQLREGACAGNGRTVGAANAYGPLAVNEQGRGSGSATLAIRLSPVARYHVRLGPQADGGSTAIACADLTPPTR